MFLLYFTDKNNNNIHYYYTITTTTNNNNFGTNVLNMQAMCLKKVQLCTHSLIFLSQIFYKTINS